MSNSCFDPLADQPSNIEACLADSFRRRLLSAAVLSAIGGALAAAGIPLEHGHHHPSGWQTNFDVKRIKVRAAPHGKFP